MSPCESDSQRPSPLASEGFFVARNPFSIRKMADGSRDELSNCLFSKKLNLKRVCAMLYRYRMVKRGSCLLNFQGHDSPFDVPESKREVLARRNDLRTGILCCMNLEVSSLRSSKSETLNTLSELLTDLALVGPTDGLKIKHHKLFIINYIQLCYFGLARNF